jgi:glutathione S-transferase
MIIVHHLGISQSERIVWLFEELGVPYQLQRYDRDPTTKLAPTAYKALHPMGIAPVITDGSLVLGESGAIIEYVIAKYGNGRLAVSPDKPNFADYLFWFHFANGTMMPSQMTVFIASLVQAPPGNAIIDSLKARADLAFKMAEERLGEVPYLAGSELTAADVIMGFPLMTMRAFVPYDLGALPNLRHYLKRIGERPAYRRAMAAGDPGMTPVLS